MTRIHLSKRTMCILVFFASALLTMLMINLFVLKKVDNDKIEIVTNLINEAQQDLFNIESPSINMLANGTNVNIDWDALIVDKQKLFAGENKLNFSDKGSKEKLIHYLNSIDSYFSISQANRASKIAAIQTKLFQSCEEIKSFYNSIRFMNNNLDTSQFSNEYAYKIFGFNSENASNIFDKLFTWPAVTFILLFVLLLNRGATKNLASLFRPFKSIKLPGTEFVLDKDETQALRKNLESTIDETRKEVQRAYDNSVYVNQLNDSFRTTIDELILKAKANNICLSDFRFTIHVPDILFQDKLYQLLDYYKKGEGGKGRTNPIRFGIIGLTWRLKESQFNGNVPTEVSELVKGWGMTIDEAEKAGKGKSTFICILMISEEGTPVGIMYGDKKGQYTLIDDPDKQELLENLFNESARKTSLIKKVNAVNIELRQYNLLLKYS